MLTPEQRQARASARSDGQGLRVAIPGEGAVAQEAAVAAPAPASAPGAERAEAPRHGWTTLLYKELLRFWKVSFQTIAAPILTALLYLLIFSHVLESRVSVFGGQVAYTAFLVPGLVMMSLLQNSFANSSSSLIQSKITGNLIFVLLTPLTPGELFAAYVLGAMTRGVAVGLGVFVVTLWFAPSLFHLAHPLVAIAFALLGSAILATLGVIAGIWADKFDQLAAFQNFIIVPLTFLSGVFYSIHSLPPFWHALSRFNPFFYMIDGFRYGFFGLSDVPPGESLLIVGACAAALAVLALALLERGWKLRH